MNFYYNFNLSKTLFGLCKIVLCWILFLLCSISFAQNSFFINDNTHRLKVCYDKIENVPTNIYEFIDFDSIKFYQLNDSIISYQAHKNQENFQLNKCKDKIILTKNNDTLSLMSCEIVRNKLKLTSDFNKSKICFKKNAIVSKVYIKYRTEFYYLSEKSKTVKRHNIFNTKSKYIDYNFGGDFAPVVKFYKIRKLMLRCFRSDVEKFEMKSFNSKFFLPSPNFLLYYR